MKGYLTVFLSLSLSVLIGFILLLTGTSIRNAGKIRLEAASDIGMNSVLSEFHIALHDRYDLLYIDASYLGKEPSLSNMESRLFYYIHQNIGNHRSDEPWGNVDLKKVSITNIVTAAEGNGNSMKNQAVKYIQDTGIEKEEADIFEYLYKASNLDKRDVMSEWSTLQDLIAQIELPRIKNEAGEWEEVPLGNPADRIYSMTGSDILYLLKVNTENISVANIHKENYISERNMENTAMAKNRQADDQLFLDYLFEKMGNYKNVKEDSYLHYQLEYIAQGETSDYENLKAAAERLLRWRFAVNASYILEDSGMYEEASVIAEALRAVQLKIEFKEPVTKSILYACAFMEAIGEVKCLLEGGRVEIEKSGWHTGVEQVVSGELPLDFSGSGGLSYGQYLACMLMLLSEDTRNLRSMDIMEMDIRYLTGNLYFSMDWCVERYGAQILAEGAFGDEYVIQRVYGYY